MARVEIYEQEFDKYYFNMKYDEALQVVGKMKLEYHTKQARYCELLVYFEQGKYEKVRHMLKNKRLEGVEENELYIISLLELQLYDEFYKAYNSSGPISRFCISYIGGLMFSQGQGEEEIRNLGNHAALDDYHTYMERRFRWFVANTIADIYLINEEKIQMIEAGMESDGVNHLQNLLRSKFESIIIIDPNREEIKEIVESNQHIDIKKILWFPIAYCGKVDHNRKVRPVQCFETLYDITHYLDICRRLNYDAVELSGIIEYGEKLFDAVREGNSYVIEFLKKLFIDVSFYKRYELGKGNDTIASLIYNQLKKYAPYVIDEIEDHSLDRKIYSILTTKGKFAYKAALWQFENSIGSNYGTIDAGMLCLSYIRILELEINERLINNVRTNRDIIKSNYSEFIKGIDNHEQEKHKETWKYVIGALLENRKDKNLELGAVYSLFDLLNEKKFKRKNPDSNMAEQMRRIMEPYLTKSGHEALLKGALAQMVEPKVRDKYRNPPAHTRYVRLEVALECREYVEKKLIELDGYIAQKA